MSRAVRSRTALLLAAVVVAVLPGAGGPAVAEDPTPPPVPVPAPYAPPAGPLFNDPGGTPAEQYVINDHLVRAIENTPKGSVLRIALYNGSIPSFRDAVLAAYRRGVIVRLIMNGNNADSVWWNSLVSVIGTDRRKLSFTTVCRYGCFDTRRTTMQHAKFYTFSRTGTSRHVVMNGSGNPTFAQARVGWNDLFTIVDNKAMYDAFVLYFDAMARSSRTADDISYHRSVTSGSHRVVFFPNQSSTPTDYYQRVLNGIRCVAAPGSGVNGRTKVTVAMWVWTANRTWNAQKLWELDQAGCDVEVLLATHGSDPPVLEWLRKPGRNGGITLRSASVDIQNDGVVERYLHEKIVMVNGGYLSRQNVRLSFMGSHNFTYNAMRGNNEVIIRSEDAATYDAIEGHLRDLRVAIEVPPPDPGEDPPPPPDPDPDAGRLSSPQSLED